MKVMTMMIVMMMNITNIMMTFYVPSSRTPRDHDYEIMLTITAMMAPHLQVVPENKYGDADSKTPHVQQ